MYSKICNLEKFGQTGKIFNLGSDFLCTDTWLVNSMVKA